MAVLGLLVEELDTLGGIAIRLDRRFPDALWSRSALHNGMKGLVKQQHARLVPEGAKSAQDRYEATSRGTVYFCEWKRESAAVPRTLRDALQGKLAFSTPADLPGLIETAREELDDCKQKYVAAHKRSRQAAQFSRGAANYDAMILCAQLADQANVWSLDVQRLQDLLEVLEGIRADLPDLFPGREAVGG
jgi:hypothetical protein